MAGEILKKKREELGQDLKKISYLLRIRHEYLKAIEEDAFEKLPVEVYAKGYIREYAKFLNVDPSSIIKAYIEKMLPPVIEKPPVEVNDKKKKQIAMKYLSVPIVLLAIIGTYFFITSQHEKPEDAPQKSTTPVQPATQPSQPAKPVQQIPKEEKTTAKAVPAKEIPRGHVLEIRASEITWLLVNIDNTESKDMLLRPGELVKLSAKLGFSLKIGNAGGIKLIFDGKDLGPPGKKGEVISLNVPSIETTDLNTNSDTDSETP